MSNKSVNISILHLRIQKSFHKDLPKKKDKENEMKENQAIAKRTKRNKSFDGGVKRTKTEKQRKAKRRKKKKRKKKSKASERNKECLFSPTCDNSLYICNNSADKYDSLFISNISYYKEDLALNKLEALICHKTQPTNQLMTDVKLSHSITL